MSLSIQIYFRRHYLFTFRKYYRIYMLLTFQFNNYDMKQMTSLYEISYYGIEQHITLTLSAWLCLFTVRNNMTLLNTLALHAIRWCSGMSLSSHGDGPWFETHTILCSISYFYCYHCFVLFALFFTQWLIYPFSCHIDILI